MREMIVIRHAESYFNIKETLDLDSMLTKAGALQAKSLGDYLKQSDDAKGFTGFVSPFQRTLDTALMVHLATGVPFTVIPDICEYGATWSQIPYHVFVPPRPDSFPMFDWSLYEHGQLFTAETFNQFLERVKGFLGRKLPQKSLVVSHGAVVYTIVDLLTGGGYLDESYSQVTNASVSKIKGKKPTYLFKKDW